MGQIVQTDQTNMQSSQQEAAVQLSWPLIGQARRCVVAVNVNKLPY